MYQLGNDFCISLIYCLHMYTFILISIYYPVISFIYKFAKLCFFSTVLNILKMCSYQQIVILGFVGNEQSPRKMCNKIDQSVKQLLGAKCTFVMKITFKTNFRLQQCTIYLFFFLTVYGLTIFIFFRLTSYGLAISYSLHTFGESD